MAGMLWRAVGALSSYEIPGAQIWACHPSHRADRKIYTHRRELRATFEDIDAMICGLI
jgi:hypothetical protein